MSSFMRQHLGAASYKRRLQICGLAPVLEDDPETREEYDQYAVPSPISLTIIPTATSVAKGSASSISRPAPSIPTIQQVLQSEAVERMSTRYSREPSMLSRDVSIHSTTPSIAKLHGFRQILDSICSKDGTIDRQTFCSTFNVNPSNIKPSLSVKSLLVDAVFDTEMEQHEQLRYVFDLFDADGTGKINKAQIGCLLKACVEQSKLELYGVDCDALADILYQHLNLPPSASLSYPEFHQAFISYVDKMDSSSSAAPFSALVPSPTSVWSQFYERNRLRIFWIGVYIILNIIAFVLKARQYQFDPVVGYGLQIARGAAQAIMLNMLLVLLPMCRSLTLMLRRHSCLWEYIPFDDHIEAHKLIGTVLILLGFIHSGAHISNEIHLYCLSTPQQYASCRFASIPGFATLPPFTTTLVQVPIWTGILMLLIAVIAFPFAAIPKLRQGKFNWFWYTHMLFGPFLILGCFHGCLSWLAKAQSFWWILPPLSIYLIERRFRYAKFFTQPVVIANAQLMDTTLAVFMVKPRRFIYRPGMYLFLNCPQLSQHEWHPFTISSAPGDQYLSVHIRNAGDWTNAFQELIVKHQQNKLPYPHVFIDGPVGAPAQDYHRYSTIVLIAGGIGVTPFASIIKDFINLWQNTRCKKCDAVNHPENMKLQKVYFHWVTRAQSSFEWFEDTMNEIKLQDEGNVIEFHQYLTCIKNEPQNHALKMFQALVHSQQAKTLYPDYKHEQLVILADQIGMTSFNRYVLITAMKVSSFF